MATVFANKDGQYSAQFTHDHKRATIYLGKIDKRDAQEFVGQLACQASGRCPPASVLQWLTGLAPKLRAKLAKYELADQSSVATIGELCAYCISQADVEPSTLTKYRDAEANLVAFFGANRPAHRVTPGDADEFRRWLLKKGRRPVEGPLAASTASKRLKQVRSFFAAAVRKRWLVDNPFLGVKCRESFDDERKFYVTREMAKTLMDAADAELRLIIALARYAGLRTPSEIWPLQLTWINEEAGTLKVLDSKRRRFPEKRWRHPPLFPEFRRLLTDAFHAAPDGATHIFRNPTNTATALRNRLERLCLKCKILPWPKLWQNMRSTRETELLDAGYPIHVVCAWLGNDPKVAIRHYAQIAKDHVRRACAGEDYSEMQIKRPKTAPAAANLTVITSRQESSKSCK
jgi:integrase